MCDVGAPQWGGGLSMVGRVCLIAIVLSLVAPCSTTHIKGTFRAGDFYHFLVKFGFQKTDRHQKDTRGYIFGNITTIGKQWKEPVTLAVLDRFHFLEYYENRSIFNKDLACKKMFARLNSTSYDAKCNPNGHDFLRKVPCPQGGLCIDEDYKWNVVKGHQFTYVIQDFRQPKYVTQLDKKESRKLLLLLV